MILETRETIHIGVNFLLVPMPVLDTQFNLNLQRFLDESEISISRIQHDEKELALSREGARPLNIKLAFQPPGPAGQLLMISTWPNRSIKEFSEEANKVIRAFDLAALTGPRQILSRDATIRDLFESEGAHSFQEIWEGFLHQSAERLQMLGKQVLGGGLRFVMPPKEGEIDPVQIEVKIESFLRDSSKIFFEVQHTWPRPTQPGGQVDAGELLSQVDEYIQQLASQFSKG